MPATIAGSHLGLDTHANRPAANAAGQPVGALYSCSDHLLVYKTDGSTWSTWASLTGSGIAAALADAAGDMLYATAADTWARLAVGGTGERLEVVGGVPVWADTPACKAYHNTTQTLGTGSFANVSLNSEDFDSDTMHDTGSSTHNITVPVAGLYLAIGSVTFAASASGSQRAVRFVVGGSSTSLATANQTHATAGAGPKVKAMGLLSLSASDVVAMQAFQDTGGDLTIGHASSRTDQNELMLVKLGVL